MPAVVPVRGRAPVRVHVRRRPAVTPHGGELPRPDIAGEVYLGLVQEDVRDEGDDSAAVQTGPEVSFAVDANFQADDLRKLAAALLDAADKLDEVTA